MPSEINPGEPYAVHSISQSIMLSFNKNESIYFIP